jgi:hypothetical protein
MRVDTGQYLIVERSACLCCKDEGGIGVSDKDDA